MYLVGHCGRCRRAGRGEFDRRPNRAHLGAVPHIHSLNIIGTTLQSDHIVVAAAAAADAANRAVGGDDERCDRGGRTAVKVKRGH